MSNGRADPLPRDSVILLGDITRVPSTKACACRDMQQESRECRPERVTRAELEVCWYCLDARSLWQDGPYSHGSGANGARAIRSLQ